MNKQKNNNQSNKAKSSQKQKEKESWVGNPDENQQTQKVKQEDHSIN